LIRRVTPAGASISSDVPFRPDLWVPRTSSTSRDQAVFADQAIDACLPPVLTKIDRFG
jgi:hypothetical protein